MSHRGAAKKELPFLLSTNCKELQQEMEAGILITATIATVNPGLTEVDWEVNSPVKGN